MKEIIDFLIKVNKLKEMPRTGWVLRKVKNPETVAEHTFRVAVMNWIFAKKCRVNEKKAIKISLAHDLCEVYAGDVTPFFYRLRDVPKDKKEREKFFRKYVRLSAEKKLKRGKEKFNLEKKSLLKLLKNFKPELKRDIFASWIAYENRSSKEADFVRQVDKIETLIQAIEYFGIGEKTYANCWWEECEENTEIPILLEFLKVIQNKFYGKSPYYEKNKDLENILDFVLKIGKLKKMSRLYWLTQGIKNPETVAGHLFTVALMAWLLGKEKKNLNMGKLIKMALCHELSAVYTGDTIPYIKKLPKDPKERKKILKKWPRLPEDEKARRFLREYKEEKEAIFKLTANLEPNLKKEIVGLWEDYRTVSSLEARFLNQINNLAVLLQGLLYQKKYKGYFADPLWEWAFERCSDPLVLEFLDALKEKFY